MAYKGMELLDKMDLAHIIKKISGEQNVMIDEPMKKHSSFRVGGTVDILVTPRSIFQLRKILKFCKKENIPIFIMGNGSNLIVSDKGIRGVVVKIFDNLSEYSIEGNTMSVYSGALLSKISKVALKNELTGLEFAAGIPGTLGGAVAMNAGAYGGEMKDIVVKTKYMDLDGETKVLDGEEHEFGYRTSYILKNSCIVLKSVLQLKRGKKQEIKALMDDLNKKRKEKQPLEMPSAGSVFKRPEGYFAGKLIEDCKLKGYRIGGAQVSEKHCGFIVNTGDATASDIQKLIKHIQKTVKTAHGIELQTEVRVIGEK